ncbi:Cocaine esterase [Colletotrichum sp. SAR 10_86]|nr:Cocaine esterase [Colletotrichum sp. SAR 10_86]
MAENKYLEVDKDSFPYVFMKNVDLPLRTYQKGVLRCNVYLPKDAAPFGPERYPVIATYGPYGKDVPYSVFHKKSWDQLNPEMKSQHASWETPDPGFWTSKGYIVVRADELGAGQSPGLLDTMSRGTSEAFFDVVEWCSEQEWSSGKVGLLGISYYAGTQWRVAARKPKGLAAMIPWEGMSDYYRDRVRHGGILSDKFIIAHLTVSASRKPGKDTLPTDIDLFVTLRKINLNGQEVFYTGTMGDPVPIVKDVQHVKENEKYAVDVEVWPTNVVLEAGETLVLEIAGHDTQGVGSFSHGHAKDRDEKTFTGINTVHTGGENSWLLLPVINSER